MILQTNISMGWLTPQNLLLLAVALGSSITSWVRLGPRVDNLERSQKETIAELKVVAAKSEADARITANLITRLTTLQEVAERRLERLEDRNS